MIRNDGYRTPAERSEQLVLGLHKGATDLMIPWLDLYLEMKRGNGTDKDLGDSQVKLRDYVLKINKNYIVGFGGDDAREKIEGLIDYELNAI